MKKCAIVVCVLILFALLLAACTGNGSDISSDPTGKIITSGSTDGCMTDKPSSETATSASGGAYDLPPMPIG